MAGTVRDSALSGQVVANYRVGRLIGRGGMGAVYEAVHQFLGRRAALKVLHAQFTQAPELTARFVNEARAANAVQHPSVVSVFEIGQLDEGTRYILMEYLDGPPLSQRVRELATAEGAAAAAAGGAPRVVSSMRLVRQLASALRALHDKGVIHRDLKPDNILIVKDPETPGGERAKLLDFGIAKFVSEYTAEKVSALSGVPVKQLEDLAKAGNWKVEALPEFVPSNPPPGNPNGQQIATDAAATPVNGVAKPISTDTGALLVVVTAKELRKSEQSTALKQSEESQQASRAKTELFKAWFTKERNAAKMTLAQN